MPSVPRAKRSTRLSAGAIPLIIATSKTLPEVREVAAAIGGRPILIVENGGAVVIPRAYGLQADGGAARG